ATVSKPPDRVVSRQALGGLPQPPWCWSLTSVVEEGASATVSKPPDRVVSRQALAGLPQPPWCWSLTSVVEEGASATVSKPPVRPPRRPPPPPPPPPLLPHRRHDAPAILPRSRFPINRRSKRAPSDDGLRLHPRVR